jgi:hypothetical protein
MPRQKLIACFFTFLAVLGLGMYLLLPQESEFRLLGIVLMIFCLPMAMREAQKLARARVPARSAPASPPAFAPRQVHLVLEATFSRTVATATMQVDNDVFELRCLLAVGSDGFTARLWRADRISGPWPSEETLRMSAQFLVPERALPRFPVDTNAQVMLDNTFVAAVKVLSRPERQSPTLTIPV